MKRSPAPRIYKVPPTEHRWIRMSHFYRGISASTLAEKYGVSKSLIEKILYSPKEKQS